MKACICPIVKQILISSVKNCQYLLTFYKQQNTNLADSSHYLHHQRAPCYDRRVFIILAIEVHLDGDAVLGRCVSALFISSLTSNDSSTGRTSCEKLVQCHLKTTIFSFHALQVFYLGKRRCSNAFNILFRRRRRRCCCCLNSSFNFCI